MKNTHLIILTSLIIFSGQALANFSGGDDFDDNSMDTAKWTNFVNEAGTSFTEANGRLEFGATGVGVDRSNALKWKANAGSYTNDWIVSVDTVNNLNESLIPSSSNETWLGFGVYFNSFDNGFGIDRNKGNNGGGYHDIVTEGSTNGVSMFKEYVAASSDEITFTISFDASAKTLSSSYDQGAGPIVNKTMDITSWGMGDGDEFTLFVYGGSRGVVVGSGDIYADNFIATSSDIFEANERVRIPCSSIVGSWVFGDPTALDTVMVSFLTNGTYFMAHDGVADGTGQPGMERGTYAWNEVSGLFAHTTTVDTCGEWGFSHTSPTDTISVVGNTLYFSTDDGTYPFERVYQPTTPPSHLGGWEHVGYPVPTHDNVAFAMLQNGIYFFVQDGDSVYDPNGQDGMERGIYTADPISGELLFTAITDTCGQWGPDDPTPFSYVVNGNTLTLNGGFDLHRVVDADCSDIDGDGLPDAFELLYYGNPTNGTPTANGDGDNLTDREEFIAGTLPNSGASAFVVSNVPPSPAGMVLSWNAVEGRTYSVKWTDSLTNDLQTLEADIPYPQNTYTDTVHAAEGEGFYQIEVKLDN